MRTASLGQREGGRAAGRRALALALFLLVATDALVPAAAEVKTYEFPRYRFNKKSRESRDIRRAERECRQGACASVDPGAARDDESVERMACLRRCTAEGAGVPRCYDELYGADPLEAGEIDVRLSSFKGCIAATLKEKRRAELSEERERRQRDKDVEL